MGELVCMLIHTYVPMELMTMTIKKKDLLP